MIPVRFAICCAVTLLSLFIRHDAIAVSDTDTVPVAHIREDFAQLYRELKVAHRDLFANISQQDYDAIYSKTLAKQTADMAKDDVYMLFQRFVAHADIAHTRIDLPVQSFLAFWEQGGRSVPFYIHLEGDRAWLSDIFVTPSTLNPGDELLAINDRPISHWQERMSALISADDQHLANTQIETMFPWLMWLLEGEVDEFTLTVNQRGELRKVSLKASTREEQQKIAAAQESTQEDAVPEREGRMLDNRIAYLKPGPFYNTAPDGDDVWDNRDFIAFVDGAFTRFIDADAQALIIDLRDNPGGTNSFSDPIIAWFARKPFKFASDFSVKISAHSTAANKKRLANRQEEGSVSTKLATFYAEHPNGSVASMTLDEVQPRQEQGFSGKVYVLVNRYSYSNAVTMSAIIQDYGFGTVIGEPTADYATTYGAMESFTLNHTGIVVGFPKALIVRPNGNRNPAALMPDIVLSTTPADPQSDLLDQTLALVRKQLQ